MSNFCLQLTSDYSLRIVAIGVFRFIFGNRVDERSASLLLSIDEVESFWRLCESAVGSIVPVYTELVPEVLSNVTRCFSLTRLSDRMLAIPFGWNHTSP
jgi:hypothetical protein